MKWDLTSPSKKPMSSDLNSRSEFLYQVSFSFLFLFVFCFLIVFCFQPPSSIDVITYELNDDSLGYGKESFFAYGQVIGQTTSNAIHSSNVPLDAFAGDQSLSSLTSASQSNVTSLHSQQHLIDSNATSAQVVAAAVAAASQSNNNMVGSLQLQAMQTQSGNLNNLNNLNNMNNLNNLNNNNNNQGALTNGSGLASSSSSSVNANAFNTMLHLHKSSAFDSLNSALRLSNDMTFNTLDANALPPFFGNLLSTNVPNSALSTLSTNSNATTSAVSSSSSSGSASASTSMYATNNDVQMTTTPQSIALHVLSAKNSSSNLNTITSTQFLQTD